MDSPTPRIKILVACHKADPAIRQDDIYMPIQVGKALHPELDLGFQPDNTGDNISAKNGSYCELTALYWAWKNLKDVDYIGLCHYRRYFDLDTSNENILSIMRKYDGVILKERFLPTNVVTELAQLTSWEDVYIFIDEIISAFPHHKEEIHKYFYRSNKFSNCNMFILKREDFDEYCQFLFKVLGETEKRIIPNGYSRLRRVLGYLSEPLLGFWIHLKKLRMLRVDKEQSLDLGPRRTKLGQFTNNLKLKGIFFLSRLSVRTHKKVFFYEWVLNGLRQDGITIENI